MANKRNKLIMIRLNDDELNKLNSLANQASLGKSSYLRMLMNGVVPKAAPSGELIETIRLLRNIANNMNQIAHVAHMIGSIDTEMYKDNFVHLQDQINSIMILIRQPVSIEEIWRTPQSGQ